VLGNEISTTSQYKQKIENDPNLSFSEKTNQINRLIGELRAKYAGIDDAISIINSTFGSSGTVPVQVTGGETDTRFQDYSNDLATELATVNGQWRWNTKEAAQNAKTRLLGKYPTFTSNINTAFKQYGI
jgi:hypothetical protein